MSTSRLGRDETLEAGIPRPPVHPPIAPERARPIPAARSRAAWLRGGAVLLFYTWVAVLLTWPLAPQIGTGYPAHIDPPFSAWRLARVAHQLEHDPARLFDGGIFWPARQTLAYSDAMLLQGVLAWPWLRAGVAPIAVANLFTLAGVIASACAAYVLARRLTGHTGAALLAGLVFAFAPYRRDHFVHLELQWAQWMPLALWAWHRALDHGRLRDGFLCGLFVLLQLLSSIYYALFLGIACLTVGGVTMAARRFRVASPALAGLVAGAALLAAAAWLYGAPYQSVKQRLGERSLEETARYSARPADYLRPTSDNLLYGREDSRSEYGERSLLPGLTPVVLAGAALVPPVSLTAAAYAACGLVAWEASLGTNGWSYPILRSMEVFRGLRAPARFAVVVQLALGVLAAVGLARLARRRPQLTPALVIAAAGLIVVEYAGRPMQLMTMPDHVPPVYAWLADQPREVTLELPVPEPTGLPFHDPFYMYAATWHWQPLVNGYSGHYTEEYVALVAELPGLPDDRSIAALKRGGVRRIIVHEALYEPDDYQRLVARLDAHPMFHLAHASADHLSSARVYAFLPNFGPRTD